MNFTSLNPFLAVYLLAIFLAVICLSKLMMGRQLQLMILLKKYTEEKIAWARKKARASTMARQAASAKANQEVEEARRAQVLEFPDGSDVSS